MNNTALPPKSAPCVGSQRRGQAGFTLVELMVSIALGLLVLVGLVALFANTSIARTEIDKASQQIENGRYALQVMTDDARHAGYFGPLAVAPAATSVPNPCVITLPEITDSLGVPLQGFAGGASDPTPGGGCLTGYKPNTAVLVVRRSNTVAAPGATVAAGEYNIQASGCVGEAAFIVGTVLADFTLHRNNANHCPLPLAYATSPLADIWPLYVRIYFITTCSNQANCTAAGADSVPTLRRVDVRPGGRVVTPMVEGVENMQLEYGLDSSADGSTDSYTSTPPTTVAGWQDVVSVRIHVLARNRETTAGYLDAKQYELGNVTYSPAGGERAYKRHAYNELVRLNNVAGRRE